MRRWRASRSSTRRSEWSCEITGSSSMRRGAIIGLGNVALHGHLPGWRRRRDVEIVAVTDVRPEQHAVVSALAPGARWYATPDDLLAEAAVDFVDICTPPSSHPSLIRQALERGRHVLCEKPLVSAPGDLALLARLAAETGRVLHTVHNWHHAPIVRRTAELIREGRIGRVKIGRASCRERVEVG